MPPAKVTVLNQDTGFTQTDTNARDGAFSFPALTVGTYRLTESNVRGRCRPPIQGTRMHVIQE
jgi:hypothetical protein